MSPKVDRFVVSLTDWDKVEEDINRGLESRDLNANAVISIVSGMLPGTLAIFYKKN